MAWFRREAPSISTEKKKNTGETKWWKCDDCGEPMHQTQIEDALYVCPKCNFHDSISAEQYFNILCDNGKYMEFDKNMVSVDILEFKDIKTYKQRLAEARKKTGLYDACRNVTGTLDGIHVVISAMDFAFIGGSMGSVVGEKIARAIDRSAKTKYPLIIISKSGGARMMEAALSLMQMAKTSARLTKLSKAGVPYISVMTNPTTGGVTASFAMLGDFHIAEPKALIGFAGPRVIKETIRRDLPEGFQRAEFLKEHGFIDIIAHPNANAQDEKYGLQGAWIVTAFGIDWPQKTSNPDIQKKQLEKIFQDLHKKKFNAVFFQVRIRADLAYPSSIEPFHEYFTGTLGKAPVYDPVAYALTLARKYGIEFHAWFNTMILRGKHATKSSASIPTLWETHPEWIDKRALQNPNNPTAYLNPGLPEVRNYLVRLIAEFANSYNVDGIQLDDYLRYPTSDFPDENEFNKYNPLHLSLKNWRRENINTFVAELYDTLMTIKPYLRFGVTPVGVYKRQDKEPAMEAPTEVYQDSREWVKRGKCDYLAPQVYFYTGTTTPDDRLARKFNPDFEKLVIDWGKNKFKRHVFIGLGIYKPKIKAEWEKQVALSKEAHADGVIFYPYNETQSISTPFLHRKLVPPMVWKSTQKPSKLTHVSSELVNGGFRISWTKPKSDYRVNIYRKNISQINPFLQNIYESTVENLELQQNEVIELTTMDRYGNESDITEIIVK
ncbi:hypothetical protein CHS0354_000452 [Potamilus streckersoni]|uniref:CoA carboxyltransferase N-terminal domain-containing protein n=1 Tax=Potamilus streckersoni TaxID=2493646 RepID=A0AAE0T6S0_9BIVA|nr:hypothetical protein CHS0354_000452 [Potamilus streckersoni]